MEIQYSKLEIATFLRDYHNIMAIALTNPNLTFYQIFQYYMQNTNRFQFSVRAYYNEMVNVFELYLLSKYMTIMYDNFFDFLQDNKIDSLNIPKNIFVNKEDYYRFSKKQIIKYIRNALNHNDNLNHDTMKYIRVINDNGIGNPMIEINLKNVKPVPFHIKINFETLGIIINEITKANSISVMTIRTKKYAKMDFSNSDNVLDNIFLRKFYSHKKLSDTQLLEAREQINNFKNKFSFDDELTNIGISYKDFSLTIGQKLKIKEDLIYWKNKNVKEEDIIFYLVNKVMPFSVAKYNLFFINLILSDYYIKNGNCSISDFVAEVRKCCLSRKVDESSPLYLYTLKFGINKSLVYNSMDFDNILSLVASIYYGYLFDTLVTDDLININNKKILPRDRVRNSFVHMRWFIGIGECFKLYDWEHGVNNEFNKDSDNFWSSNVKCDDLINSAEIYYKKYLENNKSSFMDFKIAFISIGDNKENIHGIRMIKNGVLYFLSLNKNNPDYLYKLSIYDDNNKDILANNEQIYEFLNELNNLSDYEKTNYEKIIEKVKLELHKTILNNQNNDRRKK